MSVDSGIRASAAVDDLAARGQYSFTTAEMRRLLGTSDVATRAALRRLTAKGKLAMPARGFHVIVPPEYRTLGCLPAGQFVPDLMRHLRLPYYAGLLTAAAYHGASHQAVMVFQVVLPRTRRPIECGRVRVEFVARKNVDAVACQEMATPRGMLRVSAPEGTALDLAGYPHHAGGLSSVATVLAELRERLDPAELARAAESVPVPWAQRLGFLLDLVGGGDCTPELAAQVARRAKDYVLLAPGRPAQNATRDKRWRVRVNAPVEPDDL